MQKIIDYFNHKNKVLPGILGLILFIIVSYLDSDSFTGDLDLSALYIIPISVFAWFFGPVSTIYITILCTLSEIMLNNIYITHDYLILEGILKFLFFLITALILLKLKKTIEKLNNLTVQLQESLYKEKEISALKSSFISTVSHEFRTPLATIQAINSIIKNYPEKMSVLEKTSQHNIIAEQVNNLAKMLDEFNIIGKIESDKLELSCEDINVTILFDQIIRELQMSGYDTGRIKSGYNCSDLFYSDKRLIRQITTNLLTNSLKYSLEEITFNIKSTWDNLVITIKDKGIGIPQKEQKMIFEQFYRASNIQTQPGTGLGLSIIKKSVSLCNGSIVFNSKINEGTEFIVTIPNQEKK